VCNPESAAGNRTEKPTTTPPAICILTDFLRARKAGRTSRSDFFFFFYSSRLVMSILVKSALIRVLLASVYRRSLTLGQLYTTKMRSINVVSAINFVSTAAQSSVFGQTLRSINLLKPSGFFRYHQVYNIQNFYMVHALRLVFCADRRTETLALYIID
jgi:hypothetical protein